ncbi:hypothetical protein L6R50_03980 [Myxococcota bacterium]|nr:hypothetical protein [Myxococcota bacterium]
MTSRFHRHLLPLFALALAWGCTAPGTSDDAARGAVVRLDDVAGGQGMTMQVALRGTATDWATHGPTVDMGDGIVVEAVSVEGNTYAEATITIAADAALGRRDVVVEWGDQAYEIDDGFVVQSGVVFVDPGFGRLGETIDVTLTGVNTTFQDGYTQASFGEGVFVERVVVHDPALATATISVDPTAAPGARDVVVFNGGTAWTAFGAFQVDRSAITVTFEPVQGRQGQTLDFSLRGTNTEFVNEVTTVDLGPDIQIQYVNVIDEVNAFGRMKLSNAAELGFRDVVVQTDAETLTIHDGFEVLETPANVELVQVALELSVSRSIDNDTCAVEETVDSYVIFYQPLDTSCGPPPLFPIPFPYDANYDFDVSTDYVDCPSPRTFDAGDEVYLVSLDGLHTITLVRYQDSYSGFTAYVPEQALTLADYPFNTPFRLEVPGSSDPDQVPAFTCDDCINVETGEPLRDGVVFTTVPKDFTLIRPMPCHDLTHDPTTPLQAEWTVAETYDVAMLSLVLQTTDAAGDGRFLLVLPWDDGYWQWDPGHLGLVPEGSGYFALGDGRADVPEFYLPFGSGGKNQADTSLGWSGAITLRAE